ncbi:MAG: hypothetical protein K2Q01_01095 [Rickettsiales bacterium]|nr:hypothetical protein [Rickettsiales bacterium]
MTDTPDKPGSSKAAFVPLEDRDSQNIKPAPFIKDYVGIIGLAAIAAVAGFLLGKRMEPKNIKLGRFAQWKFGTDKIDRQSGAILGAELGAIWGIFHHWKKAEGKQLGIQNLSKDLHTAIDPEQLEREAKKEEALVADLKKLEERLSQGTPKSHGASITSRREQSAAETGITAG